MLELSISIYLDRRRQKSDGTYPVKLRVFTKQPRKQVLYPTQFSFTESQFASIWETTKPRKEFKENRIQLTELEAEATKVARKLSDFNFEDFERLMFNKTTTKRNINYYFAKKVEHHQNRNKVSTANSYSYALKCLLNFHGKPNLDFNQIVPAWLVRFENHCISIQGKSITTVGIYLRNLRAVFNDALADKAISIDTYPFGNRKYSIPSSKKVKKALSPIQLKTLFEGTPQTPEQEKAKAFWFFSFGCNGMNIKDILSLKCSDVSENSLSFIRAKTAQTKQNSTPIIVHLTEFTKGVIEQYGNLDQSAKSYVFPVINPSQNAKEQLLAKDNFTRMINQNFLKYAKYMGINEPISTYWARHSFATMAIRKGATMDFVGEAFGHSDLKTTQGYFAGFEDETKKDFAGKMFEF